MCVVVTEDAKGIGRAVAERLAAENIPLLLVDIDELSLSKTAAGLSSKSVGVQCVAGSVVEEHVVELVAKTAAEMGGASGLSHNAGIQRYGSAAVHSSGELGIQLASMLHLGAVLPNLNFAADAHYHHLSDDILEGGKLPYVDGSIEVPTAPGLGVTPSREKIARYAELYREAGGYTYDRDPARPDWHSIWPEKRFADPSIKTVPGAN